jgi:hypothetical protein
MDPGPAPGFLFSLRTHRICSVTGAEDALTMPAWTPLRSYRLADEIEALVGE